MLKKKRMLKKQKKAGRQWKERERQEEPKKNKMRWRRRQPKRERRANWLVIADHKNDRHSWSDMISNIHMIASNLLFYVSKLFSWISINSKFENRRNKKLLNWEKNSKRIKRKLKGWNKIENLSQWRHESFLIWLIFMRSLFTLGCMAKLTFGRKQVKWFLSQSNFGIFIS